MAKQLTFTADRSCPYCLGTKAHSKSQRHRCKANRLAPTKVP